MSSEFRNFLELSYEELEELNLNAKDQRKKRVADRDAAGRADQVPDGRAQDQGGDGGVLRP